MKTATATEIKTKFGQYLDYAQKEPVTIEKSGRDVAVMISMEEYQRFQQLEEMALTIKVREAIAGGFAGVEETKKFLTEMEQLHGGA